MRHLILFVLLLVSATTFSQNAENYKRFLAQIKKEAKIDANDKTVYNLLNEFYEKILQSDQGELDPAITSKIQKLYEDGNAKNLHILSLLLYYQDLVTRIATAEDKPDAALQLSVINDLERETQAVYQTVPVLIKIYKAEALNTNGQNKESEALVSQSLNDYPDSVPLKVYQYLNTKDEKIKSDLVKNHSRHWMVQQFGIK